MAACSLQDTLSGGEDGSSGNGQLAASEPTPSWYVRRDEAREQLQAMLAPAVRAQIDQLRDTLNFRDLKVVEALFYCQLRNEDIAQLVNITPNHIAQIKHRCLKQITAGVEQTRQSLDGSFWDTPGYDALLTETWEALRLSGPKRSTLGAFLLQTLEPQWYDYVDFHLNQLGCRFCQANIDDLERQSEDSPTTASNLRHRILESTVGFLRAQLIFL